MYWISGSGSGWPAIFSNPVRISQKNTSNALVTLVASFQEPFKTIETVRISKFIRQHRARIDISCMTCNAQNADFVV